MKNLSLLLLVITSIVMTSCKKEVSPELEITVIDTLGDPVKGIKVKLSVDGAIFGVLNPQGIDSTVSDNFGKAFFEFDNTILVEASIYNSDVKVDSTSILLETKRLKKNEENVIDRTLIYR